MSQRRNGAGQPYDWSLFKNRDIRDKYTLILKNKFYALHEISETPTPNDKYDNFVNAHVEKAAECIPTKQRTACSKLINIYLKEQREYIQNQIKKLSDSAESIHLG